MLSIISASDGPRPVSYHDPFIARLHDAIGALIEGEAADRAAIEQDLQELAAANNPAVRSYWRRTGHGQGIPDTAFRGGSLFHFQDAAPVLTFRTSGTSGRTRGLAQYSERGLDLMHRSICVNAGRHLFQGLERPAVIRLVPDSLTVPDSVMAYGMALLARTFGDAATSACVVGSQGLDLDTLMARLDRAVAEQRPVVMIGGSFAFVHLYDALIARNRRWRLPAGSRIADAGGFKGRSRELEVDALRGSLAEVFGVPPAGFTNLFGMTELASQLYDSRDIATGPQGERPKGATGFVTPRVRDPFTGQLAEHGPGLLEVADLCILDRPCTVLTGDWGIAAPAGVAITGRIAPADSRGCALSFEATDSLPLRHSQEVIRACA